MFLIFMATAAQTLRGGSPILFAPYTESEIGKEVQSSERSQSSRF